RPLPRRLVRAGRGRRRSGHLRRPVRGRRPRPRTARRRPGPAARPGGGARRPRPRHADHAAGRADRGGRPRRGGAGGARGAAGGLGALRGHAGPDRGAAHPWRPAPAVAPRRAARELRRTPVHPDRAGAARRRRRAGGGRQRPPPGAARRRPGRYEPGPGLVPGRPAAAAAGQRVPRRRGHRRPALGRDAAAAQRAASEPARPPAAAPGNLRLAVLNLHNLFNGDGRGGGFPTARGARTPAQLRAQLDALVATLHGLDPHVAALMELENDGYGPDSSLAQLVAALNAGGGDWAFVDAGHGPGGDAIRVALVYRRSRLRPLGAPATLEDGPFGRRSRVPLAQAFVPQAGGRDAGPAFVLVANHFKSKGCGEATGADADQGDGQACWNATRVDSARRLAAWMASDPTGTGTDLAAIV